MTQRALVLVVQAVPLLVTAWLLARAARRQRQKKLWMVAAWALALMGLTRLLWWDPALDVAVAAVTAVALVVCGAVLGRLAGRWRESDDRVTALGEELSRSEERYRFLLNRLPEAFVVLDGDTIVFANRAFAKIFGLEPERAKGQLFPQLIAQEWRAAYHRRHSLESTTPGLGVRRLEVEVLISGGSRLWVEMRFATSHFEGHPAEVVLIADINERQQAQQRLERFTEAMLSLGGDFEANIQRLTAVCGEMLGATCALYNRLQGELLCTMGGWQLPEDYQRVDRAEGHLCFDVIRRGPHADPLVVRDLGRSSYADSDPNVRRYGLSTYAGLPVVSRGRTAGSVCVVFQDNKLLEEHDLRVLQIVAAALGLEEDRWWALEVQRAGSQIAEVTQRVEDLPSLFAAVHRTVAGLVAAVDFSVALYNRQTETLTFPYSTGPEGLPAEPSASQRALAAYTLRQGRPVHISPEGFAQLVDAGEGVGRELECEDFLGIPLEDRRGPFGVMILRHHHQGQRFSAQEEEALAILASHLARAVEGLRAAEELRQSERKYRTLVDRMQDGMFLVQGRRVIFCNEALSGMLGRPVSELEGSEFLSLIAPEDRELVLQRYHRPQAGETVPGEYELRLLHADGRRRVDVLLHVGVIDYQGRPAILGTVRDLTERKRLEAQLRQAQRIEALGQLAGGVAHDFNNLLMAIQGSAQLLQQRLAGERREELATILAAAERGSLLTRGLLAFAQRQVLEPRPLDLNRHIGQTLPILRRIIPENIRIDFEPAKEPVVVEVDAGQLDQVLMNLAVNSRDAMEGGGQIVVRTAAVNIDEAYRATHPWAKVGPHALLQVRDTGVGMDAETLARIFEPFFTTKSLGRGTGLGLSTVYGIVKQHGGMIDVASEVGVGTTVNVYFPLVAEEPTWEVPQPRRDLRGRGELILVVEDEEEVRQILLEALRDGGYRVHEAENGADALEFLLHGGEAVALVLSDVVMPRVGGKELLEAARAQGVRVPFLFSSGYGRPFIHRGNSSGEQLAFLAKPYSIDELLSKVREIIESWVGPPD